MRKPRDYDAELQLLDQRAKSLKQRKISQLGELVIACGADVLAVDVLAGALLAAITSDTPTKEVWRTAGTAMFQRKIRRSDRSSASANTAASQSSESGTVPPDRQSRAS